MKVQTTFYRRMVMLIFPLEGHLRCPLPRAGAEFRQLQPEDVPAYLGFRPDQREAEIRRRMGRGDRGFAFWMEGRIVDAGWIAAGKVWIPYLRQFLHLDPQSIYYYDSYTDPEYRGIGLYMARNGHIALLNQSEGYTRSIALVALENLAPLELLQRAGLRAVGVFSVLRLGPWQVGWQKQWTSEPLLCLTRRLDDPGLHGRVSAARVES